MHREADLQLWRGRCDEQEGPAALRWHQRVQPLQPAAPPGVALLGFACDAGVRRNEGRAGAAEGPAALRRALANLAWHQAQPVYDAGDVVCVDDELEAVQTGYGERTAALLDDGHLTIGLGGGHEIAWAAWRGLATAASRQTQPPRIGILNLDAHFDLRAAPRANSGTSFRQIAEDCAARGWSFHYLVLGIAEAANTAALFERARDLGTVLRLDEEMRPADLDAIETDVNGFLAGIDWLYLTVCLDVLPAFVAPGVSAPAAMGVALEVIERVIQVAKASGKIRLADVAELNPRFDIDNRTARLAARLVWRLAR